MERFVLSANTGKPIYFTLIRSHRKTISLKVNEDGSLTVASPLLLTGKKIDEFVLSKERWIESVKQRVEKRQENMQKAIAARPDGLLYRGKMYPLLVGNAFLFDGSVFTAPEGALQDILIGVKELYRTLAKAYLPRRTMEIAAKNGFSVPPVRITLAASRWGSCSGRNSVCFSYKLILADDEAIDSVILHELCHMREKNHQKGFWDLLYRLCPNYEKANARLKALGVLLRDQGYDRREKK